MQAWLHTGRAAHVVSTPQPARPAPQGARQPGLTLLRGKLDGGWRRQLPLVKGAGVARRRQRLGVHLAALLLLLLLLLGVLGVLRRARRLLRVLLLLLAGTVGGGGGSGGGGGGGTGCEAPLGGGGSSRQPAGRAQAARLLLQAAQGQHG